MLRWGVPKLSSGSKASDVVCTPTKCKNVEWDICAGNGWCHQGFACLDGHTCHGPMSSGCAESKEMEQFGCTPLGSVHCGGKHWRSGLVRGQRCGHHGQWGGLLNEALNRFHASQCQTPREIAKLVHWAWGLRRVALLQGGFTSGWRGRA